MLQAESNRKAVEGLFVKHARAIYALGKRMCRSSDEAEDLVQETFLRAQESWHTFEDRANPKTWLWTIALRACQQMTRKRAGEPSYLESYEELLPSKEYQIPAIDSGSIDALDSMIQQEIHENVERAIADLPYPFRVAVVLKDFAELSIAEIATVLGLHENTVKTRIHRARLKLRRAVADALPKKDASKPNHSKSVCLTLLAAKQEALDRGTDFPVSVAELCHRCKSLFDTLDLTYDACLQIRSGQLPPSIRELLDNPG